MARPRRTNSDPLRLVVKATPMEGSVTVMMPVKGRWWSLDLECGHHVERSARYEHQGGQNRGWAALWHPPGRDKMLPAPKLVRCSSCGRAARTGE